MNLRFLSCASLALIGSITMLSSHAQTKPISGVLLDSATGREIASGNARNILTGKTATSHRDGRFSLAASKGNILSFTAKGYYTDTLTVTDSVLQLSVLEIKLRQLPATLPDVVVYGNLNSYQVDSIERRKDFLATVGEVKIPTVSKANDLGFGVGINIDRFSKREKHKRAARELFDITEEDAYIDYRWNDSLVYKYTKLKGDSLTDFMQTYRPSWEWLRKNPDEEDMVHYINKSLKKYFGRKQD